jgi:type III pantothenate kinase
MSLNFLAISIGNTRTRIAAFIDDALTEPVTIDNANADALLPAAKEAYARLPDSEAVVVLASVNPGIADRLVAELKRELPAASLQRVERDLPVPIGRQLDPESIVGEDRLLNAAGAYETLKQACVIIDAGTAITVDYVDGAGTFHGGAIGPGAQMMLDSLHRHTAQLPEVKFGKPVEAIGHNTLEAMRAAAFHGLRGMVRELVEQYAEIAGNYPLVVATGGDAPLLFGDYELVERVVPELTLIGMAAAVRAAARAEDE